MNFMSQTLYDFSVNDNANNSVSLEKYRGKTLLMVYTAIRRLRRAAKKILRKRLFCLSFSL